MDVKEYYQEVRKAVEELKQLLSTEPEGQPQASENCVYLVSVKNRMAGTTPGSVVLADVYLAGKRIADGTHEVANASQIRQFLASRQAEAEKFNRLEVKKRQQFVVNVPAAEILANMGAPERETRPRAK